MSDVPEPPLTMTAAEFDSRLVTSTELRAREIETARQETRLLQSLLERKQKLVVRLEVTLAELQAEQETINAEVRRLLTPEEQRHFAGQSAP